MKNIDRLKYELGKAKERLEQENFFVTWLESQIRLEKVDLKVKSLNSLNDLEQQENK